MAPTDSSRSIVLQDRDLSILRGLFESRLMTATHAAAIHFDGRKEAAKKRLQKLKSGGFIWSRQRRAFEPEILTLSSEGLALLKQNGVLNEYPPASLPALRRRATVSESTVRHELQVMDIKAAFYTAIKEHTTFSMAEFGTWPRLYAFKASSRPDGPRVTVRPDGFLRIHEDESDGGLSEHTFFLEVDRSTETLDTLAARAAAYLGYFRSGEFAVRNGASPAAYRDYPFRVLIVLKTAERRNNLLQHLAQQYPAILTQVSAATLGEVVYTPFSAIWIRPLDYRNVLGSTTFGRSPALERREYQRSTSRDILVENRVTRRKLIGE